MTATLEEDGRRFGMPVTRVEYPPGIAGVRLSLSEMSRRIYEGIRAPSMQQLAEMIVRNWAQIPASRQLTNKQAAQVFLDYTRAQVRYRPDPAGTEYVKSAAISLCAPGAAACIPVEDCDGLCVAFLTLCGTFGIPIRIIKQMFGGDQQEHVLGEIQDDDGAWYPADPSVPNQPVGWKAYASHEDVIDPNDPNTLASLGAPEAEFIGVGRASHWSGTLRQPRSLVQLVGTGLGSPIKAPQTFGQPPTYALLTDRKVFAGNRYRVGMLVSTIATPNVPDPGYGYLTVEQRLRNVLGPNWRIEQLTPTGDVTGGIQSWVMQGVATSDQQLTDSSFLTYSVIAGQVPDNGAPPASPPTGSGNVGPMKAAAVFGGLGLLAYYVVPRILGRRRR